MLATVTSVSNRAAEGGVNLAKQPALDRCTVGRDIEIPLIRTGFNPIKLHIVSITKCIIDLNG